MSKTATVREAWQAHPYAQRTRKGADMAKKKSKKKAATKKPPATLKEAWQQDQEIRKLISQDLNVRTGLSEPDREKAEQIIADYPRKQ